MDATILGWPPDGPTLRLDYREFSYAGKFVMSTTGKAVLHDDESDFDGAPIGEIKAAVAFSADRTDPGTMWLRYLTVRHNAQGNGFGPRLCHYVVEAAAERDYDRARIGVNNPFAFHALYRAGFAYTGDTTGMAELILERPTDRPVSDRSTASYQAGLEEYRARDLSPAETTFLTQKQETDPPRLIHSPSN